MPRRAVAAVLAPVAWAAVLTTGCASGRAARPAAESQASTAEAAASTPELLRQGLFRVRFRGVDGRGRIRLTLRTADSGDFALEASDTFGRRLWSFESRAGASLLLDHRAAEYCRLEGDIVFRAVALAELSVSTLPRVLLGELPLPPPAGVEVPRAGEVEFRSADGRLWSARYDEGRLATWTLWQQGRPQVWWKREDSGGILSHSDGAQALWKTVAVEEIDGLLTPLEVPEGYAIGDCDDDDLS